jgi:histidine ammonia-lyase
MITLTGNALTIEDLVNVAYGFEEISLSNASIDAIKKSHQTIVEMANSGKAIYGVNTGFGIFADKSISRDQSIQLNRNLIYSHAVATGDPLPIAIVRAAMVIRANALAKGFSGIQYEIVETLVGMVNEGVTPVVSSKGSLGSSGDLCLLAQIGLVLIEDEKNDESQSGRAYYQGQEMSGKRALELTGLKRRQFSFKDGLALINGATFSTAISALATYEAVDLATISDVTTALSLEALCGVSAAFHRKIHAMRNMIGQQKSAEIIRSMIKGSTFIDSREVVQDAYSIRCAPQVHGSVRDTISHTEMVITAELNAATDNPLMVDHDTFISGGNFHGEPVGLVSDFLSIALAELGAISERRTFRLTDEKLNNGLPSMLVDPGVDAGVNSGVMILQYTAAALVLQNQTFASPDSVRSLPTSANQEDHNANSYNAALHLWMIIENTWKIIAIELYCAVRAIHIRKITNPNLILGNRSEEIYQIMSKSFKYHPGDVQWREDLEKMYALMINPGPFRDGLLFIVNGQKPVNKVV